MTFEQRKREAARRGWNYPPDGSPLAAHAWQDAWLRYWNAMEQYDLAVARGNRNPGRPVPPHRSA